MTKLLPNGSASWTYVLGSAARSASVWDNTGIAQDFQGNTFMVGSNTGSIVKGQTTNGANDVFLVKVAGGVADNATLAVPALTADQPITMVSGVTVSTV